jgi:hypothetical protein
MKLSASCKLRWEDSSAAVSLLIPTDAPHYAVILSTSGETQTLEQGADASRNAARRFVQVLYRHL